jgi:hypothetical protein
MGVGPALTTVPPLDAWLHSADAARRMDVYAEMYFFRLRDCLAEDFPVLFEIIGARRFHNLVTDYLLAHPPEHPSIRHAGGRMPVFLQQHPLVATFPFAADLAAFEWARGEVFDAEDPQPMNGAELARIPAETWPRLCLRVIAACRLLQLEYPVDAIWSARASKPAEARALLVWRQGFLVYHRALAADEARALAALLQDAPLAVACAHFGAAEQATRMLEQWFGRGLVAGYSVATSSV